VYGILSQWGPVEKVEGRINAEVRKIVISDLQYVFLDYIPVRLI